MPTVLPYIPRTITVHMGAPNQPAENVTVPFLDYVKNVASSEVYPTWEPSALRANILAIISFALNRVYTEHYVSRGYDFQITADTAYDQKFIKDRSIFENVGAMVDELFTDYIRRVGFVEPLATQFCNGTTTICPGLSQWGSQDLAQQGFNSMQILRHYYGNDIELVMEAPIRDLEPSYPGIALNLGDINEAVFVIQVSLNRIGENYPAIPHIWPVNGIYNEQTREAVIQFQRIFNLTPDGIVGRATWYKLVYLYVGVTRLSELDSLGQQFRQIGFQYYGPLREGDQGDQVWSLQYMLSMLSQFQEALNAVPVDGIFGPATRRAVEAYQLYAGLTVDGVVGRQTWDSLYQDYLGIGNYLQLDRVRFPEEGVFASAGFDSPQQRGVIEV